MRRCATAFFENSENNARVAALSFFVRESGLEIFRRPLSLKFFHQMGTNFLAQKHERGGSSGGVSEVVEF